MDMVNGSPKTWFFPPDNAIIQDSYQTIFKETKVKAYK